MGPTFASIGVTHIVGGAVGVIVWVGGGSIYSNEFAPVYLQIMGEKESKVMITWLVQQMMCLDMKYN